MEQSVYYRRQEVFPLPPNLAIVQRCGKATHTWLGRPCRHHLARQNVDLKNRNKDGAIFLERKVNKSILGGRGTAMAFTRVSSNTRAYPGCVTRVTVEYNSSPYHLFTACNGQTH